MVKDGHIKCVYNHLKPVLTPKQRRDRINFAINHINTLTCSFHSINNVIHIDEKWFYISRVKQKTYLLPDESTPIRRCKNKRFIRKIMFICAVANPRPDINGRKYFDGKLG